MLNEGRPIGISREGPTAAAMENGHRSKASKQGFYGNDAGAGLVDILRLAAGLAALIFTPPPPQKSLKPTFETFRNGLIIATLLGDADTSPCRQPRFRQRLGSRKAGFNVPGRSAPTWRTWEQWNEWNVREEEFLLAHAGFSESGEAEWCLCRPCRGSGDVPGRGRRICAKHQFQHHRNRNRRIRRRDSRRRRNRHERRHAG